MGPVETSLTKSDSADRVIISTMLAYPEWAGLVVEHILPEDFEDLAARTVYTSMRKLFLSGEPINRMGVASDLGPDVKSIGGLAALSGYDDPEVTKSGLSSAVDLLLRTSCQRKATAKALYLAKKLVQPVGRDELVDVLCTVANDFREYALRHTHGGPLSADELSKILGNRFANKERIKVFLSGFPELDGIFAGAAPGNLVVLAGRPSMGKSAMALQLMLQWSQVHKAHGVMFNLEMSAEECGLRLLALLTPTHEKDLFSRDAVAKKALKHLSELLIHIDDGSSSGVAEIYARARQMHSVGLCDYVVIDYLQLLPPESRKAPREQQVAETTRALKLLAKTLKIPVLVLSQLNRSLEYRDNKRPRLSDLRESGAIEQDADVVLFLYRPKYYDKLAGDECEVIVAKQRNGRVGRVVLSWDEENARFGHMRSAE